jgi:hypothetical protein
MVLVLDQVDDSADNGGIVQSDQAWAGGGGSVGGRTGRSQSQLVRVTAINGNVVTITPGLHMPNWRASQTPQAWWWGSFSETASMVGIEALTVEAADGVGQANVTFNNAYNVWVKNVRSINGLRAHWQCFQCAHMEVRDTYAYDTQLEATTSYGLDMLVTSDVLFINNICHKIVACIMGTSTGSVFAFNYSVDTFFSNNWYSHAMYTHDSGSGMVLVEGNQTGGIIMDDAHGNSPLYTFFRNHFRGQDEASTARSGNEIPVKIQVFGRAVNWIGNVLGRSGFHTQYEYSNGPQGNLNDSMHSIYWLGFPGNATTSYDMTVVKSLFRWGNFDTVTGTNRFLAAEVPTTGITFVNGNPVPSSQTLPASFFLSAKPSWWSTPWGNPAWPPIGPEVRGGNHPDPNLGGRAWQIPARLCYYNAPIDPNYPDGADRGVLLFDANNCYGSASSIGAPPAPSNLTVQ